jgi:hypothetical protein
MSLWRDHDVRSTGSSWSCPGALFGATSDLALSGVAAETGVTTCQGREALDLLTALDLAPETDPLWCTILKESRNKG